MVMYKIQLAKFVFYWKKVKPTDHVYHQKYWNYCNIHCVTLKEKRMREEEIGHPEKHTKAPFLLLIKNSVPTNY